MPELSRVIGFMSVLEPVFTKPAFTICIRLVARRILCPARRTITGMYPFVDPKREKRVGVYHYFFRAAFWLQCELFACWARFLVGRLCADARKQLWGKRIRAMSSSRSGLNIAQELLVNALVWAA